MVDKPYFTLLQKAYALITLYWGKEVVTFNEPRISRKSIRIDTMDNEFQLIYKDNWLILYDLTEDGAREVAKLLWRMPNDTIGESREKV